MNIRYRYVVLSLYILVISACWSDPDKRGETGAKASAGSSDSETYCDPSSGIEFSHQDYVVSSEIEGSPESEMHGLYDLGKDWYMEDPQVIKFRHDSIAYPGNASDLLVEGPVSARQIIICDKKTELCVFRAGNSGLCWEYVDVPISDMRIQAIKLPAVLNDELSSERKKVNGESCAVLKSPRLFKEESYLPGAGTMSTVVDEDCISPRSCLPLEVEFSAVSDSPQLKRAEIRAKHINFSYDVDDAVFDLMQNCEKREWPNSQ